VIENSAVERAAVLGIERKSHTAASFGVQVRAGLRRCIPIEPYYAVVAPARPTDCIQIDGIIKAVGVGVHDKPMFDAYGIVESQAVLKGSVRR
jgi:hypothetical protein